MSTDIQWIDSNWIVLVEEVELLTTRTKCLKKSWLALGHLRAISALIADSHFAQDK